MMAVTGKGVRVASLEDVLDMWMLRVRRLFQTDEASIEFLSLCSDVAKGVRPLDAPVVFLRRSGSWKSGERAEEMERDLEAAVEVGDG